MGNAFKGVRWLWCLLGGILAEVALVAVAVPAYLTPSPEATLTYVIPPACLAVPFLMALWIAGKAKSSFVLNGALVGLIPALLYVPAFFFGPLPLAYAIGNILKIVGGVAGGYVVARRRARASTPA